MSSRPLAPRLFVEFAAGGHTEALGHGALHALDVMLFQPDNDERFGEAEVDEVLDRLLAELVVDAEDILLGEEPMKRAVQFPGRG